jgi:hypothetical protein
MVLSLQLLKQLVTVRLNEDNTDHVFRSDELGFSKPEPKAPRTEAPRTLSEPGDLQSESGAPDTSDGDPALERAGGRRRRRRRGRSRSQGPQA